MLILMDKTPINKLAAQYLLTNQLDSENDTSCFIVDIEQKFFKKNITPEQYAADLMKSGLPDFIKDIYLFTSEIEPNHFMAVFAHHLARCFAEFHGRKINVHISSYLSSEITHIIPPENNNGSWKIYGMSRENLQSKKLIWEGKNILEWMNDPQQTYSGRAYAWESHQ